MQDLRDICRTVVELLWFNTTIYHVLLEIWRGDREGRNNVVLERMKCLGHYLNISRTFRKVIKKKAIKIVFNTSTMKYKIFRFLYLLECSLSSHIDCLVLSTSTSTAVFVVLIFLNKIYDI